MRRSGQRSDPFADMLTLGSTPVRLMAHVTTPRHTDHKVLPRYRVKPSERICFDSEERSRYQMWRGRSGRDDRLKRRGAAACKRRRSDVQINEYKADVELSGGASVMSGERVVTVSERLRMSVAQGREEAQWV